MPDKIPQPLRDRVAIVNDDGTPTTYFLRWAQERQLDISDSITAEVAEAIAAAAIEAWALGRSVNAGVGLSGGGNLSTDITIDLEDTAVTPGSYTNTDLTVDAQGRITAASNGTGGGSGGILPVVDGSIPPVFLQNADGSLIYTVVA